MLIPTEESPFVHPLKELPDLLDRIPDAPSVKLASLEESISMSELKTTSTPRMHLRFFDDEVKSVFLNISENILIDPNSQTTPGLTSGIGYLVRGAILDLMELLEPNRKECARILLELSQGHWIVGNEKLFKAKKSKDQQQQSETAMEVDAPKGTWILDNTLVEVSTSLQVLELMLTIYNLTAPALVPLCYAVPTFPYNLLHLSAGRTLQAFSHYCSTSYGQVRSSLIRRPRRETGRKPNDHAGRRGS